MRLLRTFCLALPLTLLPALALGDSPRASASAPTSGASGAPRNGPLPELPRLAPITHPEPDPASIKDLDKLLERLTSEDARARNDAKGAVNEVSPASAAAMVAAIRARVQDVRTSLDREAAPRLLEAARKAGRKAMKAEGKAPSKRDKKRKDDDAAADEGDWLDFLIAKPQPKEPAWRDVVRLTAMVRLLGAIGTTPAVRELIQLHAYFGELLRIDIQRQIGKLRDKAVPALLEARQHDAKIIQRFAHRQLDLLGRSIPGETVSTNDTQVLADVLRAYGRTRDVDAARVVLSFTNSERVQLREAAREAIGAIGDGALWQLRDQYLGLTGEKAPKDWAWDRIAREIFALYDRARLSEVHKAMDDGLAAAKDGKIEDAAAAFDRVLARAPLYERRREMVPTYHELGKKLGERRAEDALIAQRKALRLDPKGDLAKVIQAEIAYLEGALSIDRGAPDKTAFEKAIALDPSHERAKAALASLADHQAVRESRVGRYIGAGGVGLAAILAMILLARRRPKSAPPASPPAAPSAA